MKRTFRCAVIGVSATMLAFSGASLAMAARHHRGQKHVHHLAEAGVSAGSQSDGVRGAAPGSVGGFFGGLGGAYDNSPFGYDGPLGFGLRAKAQIGSALVGGGAEGDAYTDYLQHYYYYKYDACPLGSRYVWYLRRCFSPLDLFR